MSQEPEISAESQQSQPRSRRKGEWVLWAVAAGGMVIILVIAIVLATSSSSAAPPTPAISNGMATVLEANPLITLGTPAPHFDLKDQRGRTETLSSFRGRAVVLTFGDDKCTDLCTLLAQDVLAANKDLGDGAKNVQFVAINANTFYPSVSATESWTAQNALAHTANWHFLTGSPATLAGLATKYGVDVELDHSNKSIVHGTDMFFIDPSGKEIQIGQFGVQSANTALFAHAMAKLATETLPANLQSHVAGPSFVPTKAPSTQLGGTPAPIELTQVTSSIPLSTATYQGKYVVLNFWSATCSICTRELPALQKASQAGDTHSVILGVDVADAPDAATSFIRRAATTYPMLADSSGAVAGQFEVPGLPYTVILDPKGTVVVRHPGAITTEQLEYLLQTLETEEPQG